MRRLICAAVLGLVLSMNTGCFLPIYGGDPAHRAEQLFFTAENLRAIIPLWDRIWFLDMPDHMTPVRTHGGII